MSEQTYRDIINDQNIRLDASFVEGLSQDEVDNIFIAYPLKGWFDWETAFSLSFSFRRYPTCETLGQVDDKTYECIGKMMTGGLLTCDSAPDDGAIISFKQLETHKKLVYKIMKGSRDPEVYNELFLFNITPKGEEFAKKYIEKYPAIYAELARLVDLDHDSLT